MSRAITAVGTTPGIARYQLSPSESFAVLALTFAIDASAASQLQMVFVEFSDPAGQPIIRQPLGINQTSPSFYSLAADAEPWAVQSDGTAMFPQTINNYFKAAVAQRIPRITLDGSCSVSAYSLYYGDFDPLGDPRSSVDASVAVDDLHLWVEDTNAHFAPIQEPPPLLTHVEA